jgi:protein involved in polysaccharide export with SLBB domain
MKKSAIFLSSTGLLLMAFSGCTTTGDKADSSSRFSDPAPPLSTPNAVIFTNLAPAAASAELTRPSDSPFTLGPGDRLEIEVLGHPETRAMTFVGPDGKVYFHLLAGQEVWGLTLAQTRERLEAALGKYLTDPQVAVTLREVASKQLWVLGRLNRPGIYPLNGPTTLLEAIAQAGGAARSTSVVSTDELADWRHSFVMRQGQFLPVDFRRLLREGDTSQNIYLQPDDFIYVPSALSQEVYVMGAVRFPRTVPYSERMTLVSALAGASGPAKVEWLAQQNVGIMPDAYMSHVAIVRGSLAQPQIAVVNAGDILKGKAPDVALEPGDIVYVPNAPYSTLKRYFNTIVSTFIATVAANEGTHAGGGQTLGVSVPIGR